MIDSSLSRMEELLDVWERAADRRAIFLDCYTRMTRAMCRAIERGDFDDTVWVEHLLSRFADHYFVNVSAWEHGHGVALPWKLAHDATRRDDTGTIQLLLAGVNAHINFDLVLTLVELLELDAHGREPATLDRRRRDYDRVNDVIRATADEVQDHVLERYVPALDIADQAMGRIDEWLMVRLLTSWRDGVWRHADQILHLELERRPSRIERCAIGCERRGRRLLLRW